MLRVTGLSKSYPSPAGTVKVVDDVSFEIANGTCYALLGPSGCGKTSTLRCVAGLDQPDAGTIVIGNKLVSDPVRGLHVPVHERAIGMVFQSYAIWPHLDVFENVAYPLRIQRPRLSKGEIEDRVSNALSLVGMLTTARRSATLLSGGQQQRVALARAIVRRPVLLLLDEPLSNLDARMRDQMRNELHEMINKVGVTALYVTHDQAEAFALAHRIAVMAHGEIIQEGSPREIYQRPETAFVATFLGAANILSAHVVDRCGETATLKLDGDQGLCVQMKVPDHLHRGETIQMVVRPEDLKLRREVPAGSSQSIRGKVASLSFLGHQFEYTIDIGGSYVRSIVSPSEEIEPGAAVWLEVDATRCITLRKNDD